MEKRIGLVIDGTIEHFRYGIKLTLKKHGACDLGYKYSLMMSPGDFNMSDRK